ncbi:methyl-accepting chemotaxis protein [Butyrivibrio sp. AE3003]|uniref:methyl-accepting chemotaxis protein n=1 Tax=Butyrivibrio sp. AE3003 TaxID=1496721 RepID=UPI000479D967|nr:methyl-accepting chemotaxis protein [Butyrivibrio sp. AE3003]
MEKIDVLGDYTKFGQTDANPDYPDGVGLKVFLNEELLEEKDIAVLQGDGNDNKADFMFTQLDVRRGDKLSFVIDGKNNIAYDAGRLSARVYAAKEKAEGEELRTNNTNLFESFGEQGTDGWTYGMCDWDGKNFEELSYDPDNERYYNNGKPELKRDFVEPGNGRNAAYRWEAVNTGKIKVCGSYTKFANNEDPDANGICMRIFVNGEEKKWFGGITQGNFDSEKEITFDEEYIVHEGDIVMFAVDPDGNDSYDGGRLSVVIKDADKNSDDEENGDKPEPGEGGNAENPGEDDGTSENSGEGGSDSEGRSNSTRAGDDGKGFAVVATEVGKLAENTQSSLKDVGAIIERVQKNVEEITGQVEINQNIAESIRSENEQFVAISTMAGNNATNTEHVAQQASAINDMVDEINRLLNN